MFGILSAVGDVLSVVSDHRYAAVAVLAAGAGVAARAYVPVAGQAIGRVLFAAAIALGFFDAGYSLRAGEDRTAELRAEVDSLKRDIAASVVVAQQANQRIEAAQKERDADNQKVAEYEQKLAELGDCDLTRDDSLSLQQLGRKAAPAGRAGRIRKPGPAP